jgi:hypothetical protein
MPPRQLVRDSGPSRARVRDLDALERREGTVRRLIAALAEHGECLDDLRADLGRWD